MTNLKSEIFRPKSGPRSAHPASPLTPIFSSKSDQNTFRLRYEVDRYPTRGALIFWRRRPKNYPRYITLQSEPNLADGINFRLHPMAIEFLKVENPWSKSGIRLGAPRPPQSSKSVQKLDQNNFRSRKQKWEKFYITVVPRPPRGWKN